LMDTPGAMAHIDDKAFDRAMMDQAIKKRSKPEHLAALIAFLASDDAELITGQFILADGGVCLH
ncbi:MAG: alcohol dehydrogenase, partial [Acidobacteria bacterium]